MSRPQKLNALLEQIEKAQSLGEIGAVLAQFQTLIEVAHVNYSWLDHSDGIIGCSTLPEAWLARYAAQRYHRIDPVVLGCYTAFYPVDWRDLDWSSRVASAFRKDALAHGVGPQGFSIPVRGPSGQYAVFSVYSACDDAEWSRFTRKMSRDLILVAHYVNRRALALETSFEPLPEQPLSAREAQALSLLAEGHSRAHVAQMLDISEHTLRVYIEGARDKLQAQNTTHAVARAIAIGLIAV